MYLDVLFLAGYLTRRWRVQSKGEAWYETRFLPRNSPVTLAALLFTLVAISSLKGAYMARIRRTSCAPRFR